MDLIAFRKSEYMDTNINTKEKILIAASRLFRKQGYHATTLNQISKKAVRLADQSIIILKME